MGFISKLFELVRGKLGYRLRSVRIPAELPRSPREVLGLLQSGYRALRNRPAAPPEKTPPEKRAAQEPLRDPHAPADPPPHPTNDHEISAQSRIEAAKFDMGPTPVPADIGDLDSRLPPLPQGYGDGRIILLPRAPKWLYAYWDVTNEQKEIVRRRGGRQVGLRLYDLTAGSHFDHGCHELARSFFLPVSPSHAYAVELGYWTATGEFLPLLRSHRVTSPPAAPSSLVRDVFMTLSYRRATRRGRRLDATEQALAEARAALAGKTRPRPTGVVFTAEAETAGGAPEAARTPAAARGAPSLPTSPHFAPGALPTSPS
jgi:hypothetical protein